MGYLKFGIVAFAIALIAAPSMAEAQNFQQLGTRRGAVTGAILGAVIGDQNNEAFAGAVIGGLVGGTVGNVGGRNLDRQFSGGAPIYNYGGYRGGSQGFGGGFAQPTYYSRPVQYQRVPVYNYGGGGYGRSYYGGGGGFGRPGCSGGRGW